MLLLCIVVALIDMINPSVEYVARVGGVVGFYLFCVGVDVVWSIIDDR